MSYIKLYILTNINTIYL